MEAAAAIGGGEEKREKGGQVDERERGNGLRFWGFDAVCLEVDVIGVEMIQVSRFASYVIQESGLWVLIFTSSMGADTWLIKGLSEDHNL
ncbi:hypothetical protein Droror1_Dr00001388 [Drosera rotundifolia]